MKTPKIIYLIQYDHGSPDLTWCEDPAPSPGMDKKNAIQYVRADHVLETLQEYKKVTDLINELIPECQHEWEKNAKKERGQKGCQLCNNRQLKGSICPKCHRVLQSTDQHNSPPEFSKAVDEHFWDLK